MTSKKELNKRSLSFGANSIFITVLVVCLVGVLNFLSNQYPKKIDLTKNKLHTFSDQSVKVMQNLKSDLTAEFYGDFGSKERYRPVFENYKKLSNKFKFELIDPNKEPTRTKQAGIKKMDTLILTYQGRVQKLEEISEEKVTNSIIKLTKENRQTVCMISGHGEASITDAGQNGIQGLKKGFEDQSYEVKELVLAQEGSIPAACSAIALVGVNKALFPNETKMLDEYLMNGGRAVIAVDAVTTGKDETKEIRELLKKWGVDVKDGLILDPISRKLGVDASIPIIALFNPDSVITKEFKQQCYFPFSRPIDIVAQTPLGLKATWIAKTTPNSWAEMDLKTLAKGEARFDPKVDAQGPLTVGITVSGKFKDTKAEKETRLVVFGSSQFASNQYSRFGGNLDLFLNSMSWALEDESLISIRSKDAEAGKIELTQNEGIAIFWLSVIIVPLLIATLGIVIWVRRKKL